MTKIYLAARFSRRDELRGYRDDLQKYGQTVTSRWLDQGDQDNEGIVEQVAEASTHAYVDLHDVQEADMVVSFTENPYEVATRGGRHVEFGVGYILHKAMVIIGPRENIFHCCAGVEQFDDWGSFMKSLLWTQYTG